MIFSPLILGHEVLWKSRAIGSANAIPDVILAFYIFKLLGETPKIHRLELMPDNDRPHPQILGLILLSIKRGFLCLLKKMMVNKKVSEEVDKPVLVVFLDYLFLFFSFLQDYFTTINLCFNSTTIVTNMS